MAQFYFCYSSQHEKSTELIYHVTYENAGGINTYVSNLKSGCTKQHHIVEVERGRESMAINALLKTESCNSSLVLHDPSFCRYLNGGTSKTIALVLHQDSNFYYDAIEEFGQLADAIICVSENIKINISDRFQSKTISLGPSIVLSKRTSQACQKEERINLIFVAREDLNKGAQHLSSIDETLIKHNLQPQWTIVFGSRPEVVPSFRTWALENESRVKVLENIPNHTITGLISQHDALVLPSQTEGHPMVLIEALSRSVPPFSFYYSSHCEKHLPVDHENIVGPSNDPEELAQRLISHHQRSRESLEQWQQSAAYFIEKHHNPSVQAQKLEDFLASSPKRRKSPLRQKFFKWKRRALIRIGAW